MTAAGSDVGAEATERRDAAADSVPGSGPYGGSGAGSPGAGSTGAGSDGARPGRGPAAGNGSERAPAYASGMGSPAGSDPAAGVASGSGTIPFVGHTDRPHTVSGGLSVLAGVMAVLFVAHGVGQMGALVIALGAAGVVAVGAGAAARGHRGVAIVLGAAGALGVATALGWAVVETQTVETRIEVLPGLVGIALLVGGVTAAVRGYERWFVSVGAGLVLATVVVSALVEHAPTAALLGATAATYVAWDCGEHAINLGEQVGRQARTWKTELVHGGAGVVVGGVGVVLAVVFSLLGVSGLPLLGLVTLLAAALVMVAALSA